jgi:hypothetical protein
LNSNAENEFEVLSAEEQESGCQVQPLGPTYQIKRRVMVKGSERRFVAYTSQTAMRRGKVSVLVHIQPSLRYKHEP